MCVPTSYSAFPAGKLLSKLVTIYLVLPASFEAGRQCWNHAGVHSFRVKIFTAASIQFLVLSFVLDWPFLGAYTSLPLQWTGGAKSALTARKF